MAKTKKRSDPASVVDTANPASSNGDGRDRIAQRAYELYLQRGGGDGGDFDDWIAAERELTAGRESSQGDRGE